MSMTLTIPQGRVMPFSIPPQQQLMNYPRPYQSQGNYVSNNTMVTSGSWSSQSNGQEKTTMEKVTSPLVKTIAIFLLGYFKNNTKEADSIIIMGFKLPKTTLYVAAATLMAELILEFGLRAILDKYVKSSTASTFLLNAVEPIVIGAASSVITGSMTDSGYVEPFLEGVTGVAIGSYVDNNFVRTVENSM